MIIGSRDWYEAHPDAPTRQQAEEDAALDRQYPAPVDPDIRAGIAASYARNAQQAHLDAEWEAQDHPF